MYDIDACITYNVDEKAGAVSAYVYYDVENGEFLDCNYPRDAYDIVEKISGVARLKEGDPFDVEVGKRIARLKLLRSLNKYQKALLEACIEFYTEQLAEMQKVVKGKEQVIEHLTEYIKRECTMPYKKD